jgi:gluconolactonase
MATQVDLPESNDYRLYEGATWLDGALYFSDISPNPWHSTLRRYDPVTGEAEDFLVEADSNGLAVDANGVLFSATAGKHAISKYDLGSKMATIVAEGFNSPNDIAIASDGTIYFSDPQQGEISAGGKPQVVNRLRAGETVPTAISNDLQQPNGVTLSPDESILYVVVNSSAIKKVTLADGLAGTIEDFAMQLNTPDGMTKDCAGNLYVVEHQSQRVLVFSPSGGTPIATITLGTGGMTAGNHQGNPTNLAFGGADRKTLFITAAYSLWQIPLQIAGYPY